MNTPYDIYKSGNMRLEIHVDPTPVSPREFDTNLGIMICFHRNYNLGDNDHGIDASEFSGWAEMEDYIWKKLKAYAVLPIYLYDHSGITIKTTPFSCPWDSGQIGFIYTTRDKIRELGIKLPRAKAARTKRLEEMLRSEIELYDQYLTGDVYGFELYENEDLKDSCWGFYGSNHIESGLFESANWNNNIICIKE